MTQLPCIACRPARCAVATRSTPRHPRAVALLLVVVIVTISALVGGAAATSAATERSAAAAAREMTQARALAWSGVQAAMAELAEQREALLAGEAPELTGSWELFADASGRRGVVRLVELEGAVDLGGVAVPEAGRLCLNTATSQMLVDLGIDDALAGRIIAARSERQFASVAELMRVPGMTSSRLGLAGPDSTATRATADAEPDAAGTNLAALVTVFAFDPNIQSGVGEAGEQFRGRQRVNLDQPWSDRLGDALTERFGPDAATGVKRIMDQGTTFSTDKDIIATLRRITLPTEGWGDILDVFTTSDDEYLIGRVDLRTAPEAVLAALPGISPEQAREIVAARERLGPEQMSATSWLVTESILTPDDFEQVVDHVTTRCLQWRIRIEAGMVDADASQAGIGGPIGQGADASGPLRPRIVLDAVIDVASRRPRVAYLRDVSMMDAAVAVLGEPDLAETLGLDPLVPDIDEEEFDDPAATEPTGEDADAPELDGGTVAGGIRNSTRAQDRSPAPPPPQPAPGSQPPGPDEEWGNPPWPETESRRPEEPATADEDGGFKDRRIGRWSAGGNRSGSAQGGGR